MVSRPIAIALVIPAALVVGGGAVLVAGHLSTPGPEQMYRACIDGLWPDEDDAKSRADACSKALQSGKLRPDEVALARLTRGVARTMLGNSIASFEDYQEALKHYEGAIDPTHPDAAALFRRATAERGLGLTDRALADFDKAIGLDPNNQMAYLGRGALLAQRTRDYR